MIRRRTNLGIVGAAVLVLAAMEVALAATAVIGLVGSASKHGARGGAGSGGRTDRYRW